MSIFITHNSHSSVYLKFKLMIGKISKVLYLLLFLILDSTLNWGTPMLSQ